MTTDQQRAQDLIDRYFDDVLTESETAELGRALRSSPEAADRFVRTARQDNALHLFFHRARVAENVARQLARAALGQAETQPADLVPEGLAPTQVRRPDAFRPRGWRALAARWSSWRGNRPEQAWVVFGTVAVHLVLIALLFSWFVQDRFDGAADDGGGVAFNTGFPSESLDPFYQAPPYSPFTYLPDLPLPATGDGGGDALAAHDPSAFRLSPVPGLPQAVNIPAVKKPLARDQWKTVAGSWGPPIEVAVTNALNWLAGRQRANGSWSGAAEARDPVGQTALTLLAFLSHREMASPTAPYGATVEKAIRYLMAAQQPDGRLTPCGTAREIFSQAMASVALAEAYTLTRIPELRPFAERATGAAIDLQDGDGCWSYRYGEDGRGDTSLTVWMIHALVEAKTVQLAVDGLDRAIDKARTGLLKRQNRRSGLFYTTVREGRPGKESLFVTAAAATALQRLGEERSWSMLRALTALDRYTPRWEDDKANGDFPLYGWYFISQAKFRQGGGSWMRWRDVFFKEVVARQEADGFWASPAGREKSCGPEFATALAALSLTVPYGNLDPWPAWTGFAAGAGRRGPLAWVYARLLPPLAVLAR